MVKYTFQVIAREDKGMILGVDYNKSPKTVFRTRSTNPIVKIDDPLLYNKEEEAVVMESVFLEKKAEKQVVEAMSVELLVAVAVGVLVCVVIFVGIVYNCSKKKGEDKDFELESSIDDDEESDSESDSEPEENYQ